MRTTVGLLAALIIPWAVLGSACASAPARQTASVPDVREPSYNLTAEQADRVLLAEMRTEFGDSPIARVESPYRGYQATIKFLFDSHQIVGYAVPRTTSTAGDGSAYSFKVTHSGTMPLSGIARAKRLRERLAEGASAPQP